MPPPAPLEASLDAALEALHAYTACDICDVLLKLKVPHAGFLPDLHPFAPTPPTLLIGPASTALFLGPSDSSLDHPPPNISPGAHWADLIPPSTVLLQRQAAGQRNAVLGGIMAARLRARGVRGVVTHGRVRDVDELAHIGLPVFARGTSAVGQGGGSKPHALDVPIEVAGVTVRPGDIVFADPRNGVVVIPRARLAEVLELLPVVKAADERVMEAVTGGMSVADAFAKFR